MKKLGWPTIFCNSLEVAKNGEITGFQMRCEQSKLTTVKALQSIGYETIASGDSYNDLGMIRASKAGFCLRAQIKLKQIIQTLQHMKLMMRCWKRFKKQWYKHSYEVLENKSFFCKLVYFVTDLCNKFAVVGNTDNRTWKISKHSSDNRVGEW